MERITVPSIRANFEPMEFKEMRDVKKARRGRGKKEGRREDKK